MTQNKSELSNRDPNKTYFTQNWFYQTKNDLHWLRILKGFNDKDFRYLEVGSFEGMSAHWICKTFPRAKLTCIDTFEGSLEHKGKIRVSIEELFFHNLRPQIESGRVKVKKGMSGEVLRKLPLNHYDVIYIDGDHHSHQVLEDAVLSWGLLRSGGIMIFDDYEWLPPDFVEGKTPENERPKMGIAAFLAINKERYELIHKEYQVAIRKK